MEQEYYTEEQVMSVIRARCALTSQATVAEAVGISQSHFNRLLGGHFKLTADMAEKFGFVEQERKFIKKVEEVTNEPE